MAKYVCKSIINFYKNIFFNKKFACLWLRSQLHILKANIIFYLKPILNNSKADTLFDKEITDFVTTNFEMVEIAKSTNNPIIALEFED